METRCSKPPTETEWQVMECVWEKAPCTGREVWECVPGPHHLVPQHTPD